MKSIDLRPRQRVEREHLDAIEHSTLRETAEQLAEQREGLEGLRERARRWPGVRAGIDSAVAAIDSALAEARHADLYDGLRDALDLPTDEPDPEPHGGTVVQLRRGR